MKTSNRSRFHKGGYAALLTTVSLALTIIAFAITSFRETRQSHLVQSRNQVKIDYSQKERAFLRALLDIVPNTAMLAMAEDSTTNQNNLNWPAIFQQALTRAQINQSIDPTIATNLGITVDVISANTGDANFLPANFINSPNNSGQLAMEDSHTTRPANLNLPPLMQFINGRGANSNIVPIINFNKRLSATSPLYTEMPYPEIAFGYTEQGSDFIAKRNWWAFTLNFGAASAAVTGIAPTPRTYLLSIYEVPSQLAISSSGTTTSLGKFNDGASWTNNITIAGSIYTDTAIIEDLTSVGSVASRGGITLGANAPTGQSIGGLTERRETRATTTTDAFYPYSSSSDSGLVSFTPINRGVEFFDYFADTTSAERTAISFFRGSNSRTLDQDPLSAGNAQNSVNELDWDHYSLGARQTQMRIAVERVQSSTFQMPTRISTTTRANRDSESRRQRTTRGIWWNSPGQPAIELSLNNRWDRVPAGDDFLVQTRLLPDGRPAITLILDKIPRFLSEIASDDVTINNSIWIGPNYGTNDVTAAGDTLNDTVLVIEQSADLSAFTNGLTIITPYTVYFDDDFNNVPVATPPNGLPSPWYPPVSVYAPDKRFGVDSTGRIQLDGQIGYLPDATSTNTINPLDLKDGGAGGTQNNIVDSNKISASLRSISQEEDIPPINATSWLTVIEEIR